MSEAVTVRIVSAGRHDPQCALKRIKDFYSRGNVTDHVEKMYDTVLKSQPYDYWTGFHQTLDLGRFADPIFAAILIVDCLFSVFLRCWMPGCDVDKARMHWDQKRFDKAGVLHDVPGHHIVH